MLTTGAALACGSAVAASGAADALASAKARAPALSLEETLGLAVSLTPSSRLPFAVGVFPVAASGWAAVAARLLGAEIPRSSSGVGWSRSSVWSPALACGGFSAEIVALAGSALAGSAFRAAASGWAAFEVFLPVAAPPRSSSAVWLIRPSVWSAALAAGASSAKAVALPDLGVAASVFRAASSGWRLAALAAALSGPPLVGAC